jgi:hypothetical protein
VEHQGETAWPRWLVCCLWWPSWSASMSSPTCLSRGTGQRRAAHLLRQLRRPAPGPGDPVWCGSALWVIFVGGLRAFLARAEGPDARLASVVVAAGGVAAGLVLVQAAIVVALTALRGNEVGVHAQGSASAARALFYLEGAVGDMALFPFAVFLAAAAIVLLRTGVLPGWLGWVGASLAILVGVLGVELPAGLVIGPLDQVISLLALAWVAGLAFSLGWPLPAAAGRAGQALTDRRRSWPVAIGAPTGQASVGLVQLAGGDHHTSRILCRLGRAVPPWVQLGQVRLPPEAARTQVRQERGRADGSIARSASTQRGRSTPPDGASQPQRALLTRPPRGLSS